MRTSHGEWPMQLSCRGGFLMASTISGLESEKQSLSLWPVADGRPACCHRPQQALAEPLVDSGTTSDQKKKPNEFWSKWQDWNLRPLRPERGVYPLSC